MTATNDPRIHRNRVLTTDADLHDLLGLLLQRANQRQFWMVFIGADGRVAGPLMPMADHPSTPEQLCDTLDLGTVPFAEVIVNRAGSVCEMIGEVSVVFVWERIGPPKPNRLDLRWARAIAREAERVGVPIRAQFILHTGGVRQLAAEELQDPAVTEGGDGEVRAA